MPRRLTTAKRERWKQYHQFMEVGVPELIIIAFIVILVFGPGKVADLGGSLGKAFREFRRASNDDDIPVAHADPGAPRFCTECGAALTSGAKFCVSCGLAIADHGR